MNATQFRDKCCFRLRERVLSLMLLPLRTAYWRMQGMQIGPGTSFSSLHVTWPHQVRLGSHCLMEHDVYFKFDDIWREGPSIVVGDHVFVGSGCEFNITQRITIGNDCLIASGVRFVDHDHGTDARGLMRVQPGVAAEIIVGDDVWIGANAVVLKGVTIGAGAMVGAGAIVTHSVDPFSIVAGVPAKLIGTRK